MIMNGWKRKISLLLVYVLALTSATLSAPMRTNAEAVSLSFVFEDGTTQGWYARGDTLSVSGDEAYSGSHSLLSTGRTANWNGPGYNLLPVLKPDTEYQLEAFVKLKAGEGDTTASMSMQRVSGGETNYDSIVYKTPVTSGSWTKLSAPYTFTGDVSELSVYFELPDSLGSFYVDEITITETGSGLPEPNATDFEDGTVQGWFGRGGSEVLTATAAAAHSGSYSLQVEGRTEGWNGPMLDMTPIMAAGKTYALSAWLRLPEGTQNAPVSMMIQRTTGGINYYERVGALTVSSGGWLKLSGEYKLAAASENVAVYFESFDHPTLGFYMDDFTMEQIPDPVPIEIQTDIPSLKDVFADDFMLGSAFLVSEIAEPDGPHAQLLKKHFNSLTGGNELKWDATEPQDGQFDFTRADQSVNFAIDNDIAYRGHTLVWHSQTPDWVFYDDEGKLASKELLFQRMKRHIDTLVGRYKGKIYAWDVVNEVIEPADRSGMRNSLWYQIAGEEFIEKAFEYAHAADPDAKLFINDYNTHQPEKRQYLHDLIKRLKDKGIPVDGVGHQMHIDIQNPSAQEIDTTINAFTDLGIEQQITELDMSSYTNGTDSWESFPVELQIKQANRYKDIFDVFKKYKDEITAVIFWGKDDGNTWLSTFPIVRRNWPLPFDERLQAKYAYWGLVDPSKLPVEIKDATATAGSAIVDGQSEEAWNRAPAVSILKAGETAGAFKALWDDSRLYVTVDVFDKTVSDNDVVEIYIDGNNGKTVLYEADDIKYTFGRSGATPQNTGDYKAVNTADGYRIEAWIPMEGAVLGREIGFDARIVDQSGENLTVTSWNDTTDSQDSDTSGFGVLALGEGPLYTAAVKGTPVIDGIIDALWDDANEIATDRWVIGSSGSTAKVRTLWDEGRLYVLAEVTDSLLSKQSANVHEQDSIEIFVDQNNAATGSFELDDGQYRINFDNEQSVNPASKSGNLDSAAKRTADGYIVEASIALDKIDPALGKLIGFDFQVNNDQDGDGIRDSVAIWNDPTGLSWQSTSRYGVLKFAEAGDGTEQPTPTPTPTPTPETAAQTFTDAAFAAALRNAQGNKLVLEAKDTVGDKVTVTLSGSQVQQAAVAGIKTVEVKTAWAAVQLPISILTGAGSPQQTSLSVSKIDPAALSEEAREKVGDNTVFDFTLTVGSQQISHFGDNQTVRVSYPYTLKAGEKPGQVVVYYIADDGRLEVVKNGRYIPGTGKIEFKAKHFSKYAASAVKSSFTDLYKAAWAADAIEAIAARGIVKGVSAVSFAPNDAVTREQFIHMLIQTLGLETASAGHSFNDVASGAYYEQSVSIAAKLEIVKGKPNGVFDVGASISRQDMAVMTYRALQAAGLALEKTQAEAAFADSAKISAYAGAGISELQQAGLIKGKPNNNFDPAGTATRAEAAALLFHLLEMQ